MSGRASTVPIVLALTLVPGVVLAQDEPPSPAPSVAAETTAPVTARCFGKTATIVALPGVETLGTAGIDVIVGTDGDDIIRGEGGNDLICAGDGADLVEGGAGKDRIDGGAGPDQLDGGPGSDRIAGGQGADTISGSAGNDVVVGGTGNDLVRGGPGDDRLSGAAGSDRLEGGQGIDRCNGGSGNDWLPGCNDRSQTRGTRFINSDTKLRGPHRGRIVIETNNVTLDCAGYDVRGPGGGFGIFLSFGSKGIVVKNCEVSNFEVGIVFDQTNGNRLMNNFVHHNSQLGFEVRSSRNNRLIGNVADDNGRIGFEVSKPDAFGNVLKRNRASRNGEADFSLADEPSRNTVVRNRSEGGATGFLLSGKRNAVRGNRATGNPSAGMVSRMSNSVIADNVVSDSDLGFLMGGSRNSITGNRAASNRTVGFTDQSMPGANTYTDNVCPDNGEGGSSPDGLCDESVPKALGSTPGDQSIRIALQPKDDALVLGSDLEQIVLTAPPFDEGWVDESCIGTAGLLPRYEATIGDRQGSMVIVITPVELESGAVIANLSSTGRVCDVSDEGEYEVYTGVAR